jgi:uncharacterized protein involved in type VI secretion and phage assembly
MAVPRIGMEVIVSFLEGDPDRPLVTGCLYNADAMPPYDLPADQTRSTVKSRSSKGGDGFNELRFEDKKGSEEVFMHAERDFLRVVKHDDALETGHDQSVTHRRQAGGAGRHHHRGGGGHLDRTEGGRQQHQDRGGEDHHQVPRDRNCADANAKLQAGALVTIGGALVQIN